MNALSPWLGLGVATLATWRLTHLISAEDGPWDVIVRLRQSAGAGSIGRMMDCFNCLSMWIAAPCALAVSRNFLEWLLAWLAVSGGASLLERVAPRVK